MELTLVIIKHDAIERNIYPDIMKRFADKGFQLIKCEFIMPTEDKIKTHYKDLVSHPKFKIICERFLAGPVMVIIYKGMNAISSVRKMIGATDPSKADRGTIRGDYGLCVERNVIHASDSESAFLHEAGLWFGISYNKNYDEKSLSWQSDLFKWSNWTSEDENRS